MLREDIRPFRSQRVSESILSAGAANSRNHAGIGLTWCSSAEQRHSEDLAEAYLSPC